MRDREPGQLPGLGSLTGSGPGRRRDLASLNLSARAPPEPAPATGSRGPA